MEFTVSKRSRNALNEFANGSWWIEKEGVKKMKIGKNGSRDCSLCGNQKRYDKTNGIIEFRV